MSRRVAVSSLAATFIALLAFAPSAGANGSGEAPDPGPWVTSAVVFDGDYAYWTQFEQPVKAANNGSGESHPARKIQAIVQQQLSTGASRKMFATTSKRIEIKDLAANAGRLAFTTKTYTEPRESKPVKLETLTAYSMGAADAVPTLLERQTMVYRGKFRTKKVKREKYRYFEAKFNCGADVHTRDVSELGVALVARTTVSCRQKSKKGKSSARISNGGADYKYKAFGYAPGSTTEVAFGDAPWGPMRFRANELIGPGADQTVVARDVTTGTLRPYADQPEPSEIVVSPDRRFAVTSNKFTSKNSAPAQTLTIFPPALNAPPVALPVAAGEASFVVFCGDYFLQVTGPVDKDSSYWTTRNAKGPLRLTLRDYSGAVVSETAAPAIGLYAGATCANRTAIVASVTNGPLSLTQFAL